MQSLERQLVSIEKNKFLLNVMTSNKILEKSEVKNYFNGTGFDRWNKIYSNSKEINTVQRNIRIGHQKTAREWRDTFDIQGFFKKYELIWFKLKLLYKNIIKKI